MPFRKLSRILPGLKDLRQAVNSTQGIKVALIDTMVCSSHPCFKGAKFETSLNEQNCQTGTPHGTHVSSILIGQHTSSVHGLAPEITLRSFPVYNEQPDGSIIPCSQFALGMAIIEALKWGADIINISGGEIVKGNRANAILADAVNRAEKAGSLIIAATGNEGDQIAHFPAALPSVLAVGAADWEGYPAKYSNYGQQYKLNGILAPGDKIPGACPPDKTMELSGSSFAAPIVCGIAALMLALARDKGMTITPLEIRKGLLAGASRCETNDAAICSRSLRGWLNIPQTLSQLELPIQEKFSDDNSVIKLPLLQTQTLNSERRVTKMEPTEIQPNDAEADAGQTVTPSIIELEDMPEDIDEIGTSAVEPMQLAPEAHPINVSVESSVSPSCSSETMPNVVSAISPSNAVLSPVDHPGPLVFTFGQIGFDYGTEARNDYFTQEFKLLAENKDHSKFKDLKGPEAMAYYLNINENRDRSNALIWTLTQDATPIYAIQPDGPFAWLVYLDLMDTLVGQADKSVERVSIAGHVVGQAKLFNGHVVPIVEPVKRGYFSWNTADFVNSVCSNNEADDKADSDKCKIDEKGVRKFLDKIYLDMINHGLSSQERAINYAGFNLSNIQDCIIEAAKMGHVIDKIESTESKICRPDSDCWDVKIHTFNPKKRFEEAKRIHRVTVDVSDVMPILIGEHRSYDTY